MFDTIHEECGVFGIYEKEQSDVASSAYYALYALQHRGQESCGIAVNDDGLIVCHKDVGLVPDVFSRDNLEKLGWGTMAVGHCRYSTTGNSSAVNAQPLVVRHCKGAMALAHNGNLVNAPELRRQLELNGAIFHTTNDSEVISYIITRERLLSPSIEDAIAKAMYSIKGAYSLIVMSPKKLIAVRDPNGFRPLCIGETASGGVVFASETCALDSIGAKFVRDVEPGEIVIADENGLHSLYSHCGGESSFCVFEYVYFARPDSACRTYPLSGKSGGGGCGGRRAGFGSGCCAWLFPGERYSVWGRVHQKPLYRPYLHPAHPGPAGGFGADQAERDC